MTRGILYLLENAIKGNGVLCTASPEFNGDMYFVDGLGKEAFSLVNSDSDVFRFYYSIMSFCEKHFERYLGMYHTSDFRDFWNEFSEHDVPETTVISHGIDHEGNEFHNEMEQCVLLLDTSVSQPPIPTSNFHYVFNLSDYTVRVEMYGFGYVELKPCEKLVISYMNVFDPQNEEWKFHVEAM